MGGLPSISSNIWASQRGRLSSQHPPCSVPDRTQMNPSWFPGLSYTARKRPVDHPQDCFSRSPSNGIGASQVALVVKNLSANAGDVGDASLIPRSQSFPGGEHGNPLQDSCLEKPMDRGVQQATAQGVTKTWHAHTFDGIRSKGPTPKGQVTPKDPQSVNAVTDHYQWHRPGVRRSWLRDPAQPVFRGPLEQVT